MMVRLIFSSSPSRAWEQALLDQRGEDREVTRVPSRWHGGDAAGLGAGEGPDEQIAGVPGE